MSLVQPPPPPQHDMAWKKKDKFLDGSSDDDSTSATSNKKRKKETVKRWGSPENRRFIELVDNGTIKIAKKNPTVQCSRN